MRSRKNTKNGGGRSHPTFGAGSVTKAIQVAYTHPPMVNPQIDHHARLRFTCTTAGIQNITFYNLLDAIFVATAAAVGYQLFDFVRVRFVEIWAVPTSNATTVAVSFPGASGAVAGDGRVLSDTSIGLEPAHVFAKPSKVSGAGLWQPPTAMVAFALTTPVGAVVDVGLSYRTVESAPVAIGAVPVGAAPGQVYYRGLDGLASAATKFPTVFFPPD